MPETYQMRIGQASTPYNKKLQITIRIVGSPCEMKINMRSSVTIISWAVLKRAISHIQKRQLRHQQLKLCDYQGNRIPVVGSSKYWVQFGKYDKELPIIVVSGNLPRLLGLHWFEALGMGISGINSITSSRADYLLREFQDVFSADLGKYVGTSISFNLDPQIAPI